MEAVGNIISQETQRINGNEHADSALIPPMQLAIEKRQGIDLPRTKKEKPL
jgi:hypothetical protein